MGKKIEDYLRNSGLQGAELARARRQFEEISGSIKTDEDYATAAIQVKQALDEMGHRYDLNSFRAQEVLEGIGNCLGKPLLIGSILDDKGFDPKFQVMVNPQDATREDEEKFVRYFRGIELATENIPDGYKFASLLHPVIDLGEGRFLETTYENGNIFAGKFEKVSPVDFRQMMSLLNHSMYLSEADPEKRKEHLREGLALWPGNREAVLASAGESFVNFNTDDYGVAIRKYLALDHDDSLGNLNAYRITEDSRHLKKSLDQNHLSAEAIALQASKEKNPEKAKELFSLASHMYSRSQVKHLENFFVNHAPGLGKVFGEDNVLDILSSLGNPQGDNFDFYNALFQLSGDQGDLYDSESLIQTPYDKLRFLVNSGGDLTELDREHGESRLYHIVKKGLNSASR